MTSPIESSTIVLLSLLGLFAGGCGTASSETPDTPPHPPATHTTNHEARAEQDAVANDAPHMATDSPCGSPGHAVSERPTLSSQLGPDVPRDEDDTTLAAELDAVLTNTVEPEEQLRILVAAEQSGRQDVVPKVIEIAKAYARDPKRLQLALCALSVATQLADIQEDLLAFAADFEAHPSLAYCALMMLGRTPEDERTLAITDTIAGQTDDRLLHAAVTEVRRAKHYADRIASIEDPRVEANWLVASATLSGSWSYDLNTSPHRVFMRRELVRFSYEHPDIVAQSLVEYERFRGKTDRFADAMRRRNEDFRRRVAALLSEDARAEYEKLAAQKSTDSDRPE